MTSKADRVLETVSYTVGATEGEAKQKKSIKNEKDKNGLDSEQTARGEKASGYSP